MKLWNRRINVSLSDKIETCSVEPVIFLKNKKNEEKKMKCYIEIILHATDTQNIFIFELSSIDDFEFTNS